jgi:uncharacterized membrane protein YhhN
MRWLLFLSRLAFISGFCILFSISFLIFGNWISEEHTARTIIVIGYIIGFIVIPATNLCYLGVLMVKRRLPVPFWLVLSNILFLVAILFFIIANNKGNAQDVYVP